MRAFRDLIVWQQAMDLVEAIYIATEPFPKSEDYALKSQMRRAAISIPSNIAEGSGRTTDKKYQTFLRISRGSARELETQIEIVRRVKYFKPDLEEALQVRVTSVSKLLNRLITSFDK